MALSFVTELNLWRRKRFRIRLDSIMYLSWFTATINTTVCWSSLFSTDLDRHQYELDPVNTVSSVCVFELFALCSSIFSENSGVYFPFLFTDHLQRSSIPVILGSVFLNVAVIRNDQTILRDQCAFPWRSKQRHQKQRLLLHHHLNYSCWWF